VNCSARILYQELRATRGYTGGYDTVRNAVRPLRIEAAAAASSTVASREWACGGISRSTAGSATRTIPRHAWSMRGWRVFSARPARRVIERRWGTHFGSGRNPRRRIGLSRRSILSAGRLPSTGRHVSRSAAGVGNNHRQVRRSSGHWNVVVKSTQKENWHLQPVRARAESIAIARQSRPLRRHFSDRKKVALIVISQADVLQAPLINAAQISQRQARVCHGFASV